MAKPFLKWAGGKTQLISTIKSFLPANFSEKELTYVEPFVGSGALLFWMLDNFPNIQKAVINDINKELIDCYKTIQKNPEKLIIHLEELQEQYFSVLENEEAKKEIFYDIRSKFNQRKADVILQSAYLIFLNRTCFNGLYRVNSKNEFNVPIGSYKKPRILDKENILAVHEALQNVEILSGDYQQTFSSAEKENTFFYFDPPYKPLSTSSNFNSYAKVNFDDAAQVRLKEFCEKLDQKNIQWMLSNSDLKSVNKEDEFFDELYRDFNINRVEATRMINSKAEKRGKLHELLITNYKV